MTSDLSPLAHRFKRESDRAFSALGIADADREEGKRRAAPDLNEVHVPGSKIHFAPGSGDCRSMYRVRVEGKWVYLELWIGGLASGDAATSFAFVIPGNTKNTEWRSGQNFGYFIRRVSKALSESARQIR